jgi:hypothetical protein
MHVLSNPLQTANTLLSSGFRIGHRIKEILTRELRHDAKYHKGLGQIHC